MDWLLQYRSYLAAAGFACVVVAYLWRNGVLKWRPSWFKPAEPTMEQDLQSLLGVLSRSRRRSQLITADHIRNAVEALVRDMTA